MPLIRKDPADAASAPGERGEAITALSAASPDDRWAAARRLGATEEGVEALGRALPGETDARVREAIFSSLVRAGSAQAVDAVVPHLRSDDPALRTGALDALRALAPSVQPRLQALLSDPDPDVRLLACEIGRSLPAADASRLLCERLEVEDQPNVCAAAIEVLAEVGGGEALPVLARCAARFSQDPFLGFSIKVAMARIGAQPDAGRG